MNRFLLAVLSTTLSLGLFAGPADAKKLSSGGMQRSIPTQKAPNQAPAQTPSQAPTQSAAPQQAAAPAAAGTAAAAPKRSWLGPVAGIAAGLGLAALASHLGFGAELANFMTMLLIGVVAMVLIGFVMRRLAARKAAAAPQGMQFAAAGLGTAQPLGGMGSSTTPAAPVNAPVAAPQRALSQDSFDAPAFEQIAKRVFIRLQAANDARDQDDLRRFTTPEMYAVIQQELLQRQGEQRTEVLQLQAQVVERAEEEGRQIVSVRFSGLIREQSEAAAEPFDEVWHLVRPADGSRDWAIAGIQALN